MNYAYIRFSTEKQDETQQVEAITEFASKRGLTIDVVEKDEGVSGGVSFRARHLNNLVKKLRKGDSLIVSEISRLGRSMSDLNVLINEELKPRKVRLIIIKMGIDIDCSELKAVDEMIFFALSFAAQIEKEMIQQRTQSALDARKKLIKQDGGFISKTGRWCEHLGNSKGVDTSSATRVSAQKSLDKAEEWRKSSPLFIWAENQLLKGRSRKDILQEAQELYEKDPEKYGTRQGCPLSKGHLSKWASMILIKN